MNNSEIVEVVEGIIGKGIKVTLTQDMLDGDVYRSTDCKGARALKSILPMELQDSVAWDDYCGIILGEVNPMLPKKFRERLIPLHSFNEYGQLMDMMQSKIGEVVVFKINKVC